MIKVTARLVLVTAIMAGALVLGSPAVAHTELKSSSPANGSTVGDLTEVTLVFTEKVRLARVKVLDAADKEFQGGAAQVTGDTVVQPVAGDVAAGTYSVAYRVVSADGHPIQGTVPFKVGRPAGGQAQASAPAESRSAGNTTGSTAGSTTNGGQRWLMVGAGLLAGMGIGLAIVFLRRGKAPQ